MAEMETDRLSERFQSLIGSKRNCNEYQPICNQLVRAFQSLIGSKRNCNRAKNLTVGYYGRVSIPNRE